MKTAYITIGNSDGKLNQAQWSMFWTEVNHLVVNMAQAVHGVWTSIPTSPYQNACWCFEVDDDLVKVVRVELAMIRKGHQQDSAVLAIVDQVEVV